MQIKNIIVKIIAFIVLMTALIAMILNAPQVFRAKEVESSPSSEMDKTQEAYSYGEYGVQAGKANLECIHYDPLDFMDVKEFIFDEDIGIIRGLIVPHHLLARDLIHEAFQAAAAGESSEYQDSNGKSEAERVVKYKTIVVFGPDHESENRGKVFTSSSSWQSPMGILDADKDLIKILSQLDFVIEDDQKMTEEHSISGLVPYVKYYFSDSAKIVPLALTKQLTLEKLNTLLSLLVENLDIETTLFISSVDFSHYLSLEEADKMDKISIDAITNKDIDKIMEFTNDNLDSPNSIIAMLNTMELIEVKNERVLNNSNSQIILNKKVDETTSYITFLFY